MPYRAASLTDGVESKNFLVGMEVRHRQLGVGLVTRTYNDGAEYCDIIFFGTNDPKNFRVDLLGGWGGYFTDSSAEITKRRAGWDVARSAPVSAVAALRGSIQSRQSFHALCANDGTLQSFIAKSQIADSKAMEATLKHRMISNILHFTRLENLEPILTEGIRPRSSLSGNNYVANDQVREDGFPQATCLSIGFPNYKMLYKYICNANDGCRGWAVLTLFPEVLIDMPCLYYQTNAAASECVSLSRSCPVTLIGNDALNNMFSEPHSGLRSRLQLPSHYTTDPQAEVLAFGAIPSEYIKGVSILPRIPRAQQEAEITRINPKLPILNGTGWFDCRHDQAFWKGTRVTRIPAH
jgi:hypothetical protein